MTEAKAHTQRVEDAIRLLKVAFSWGKHLPSMFGGNKREAFMFTHAGVRYLVVTRWQGRGGSVDEKFPFLFESAKLASGYDVVVLVIGGNGATSLALDWLDAECQNWKGKPKTILVRSSDDFRGACQRAAANPGEPLSL